MTTAAFALIRSPEVDIIIPDRSNSVISSGTLSVASEDTDGGTIDLFGTQIGILGGEVNASGQKAALFASGVNTLVSEEPSIYTQTAKQTF